MASQFHIATDSQMFRAYFQLKGRLWLECSILMISSPNPPGPWIGVIYYDSTLVLIFSEFSNEFLTGLEYPKALFPTLCRYKFAFR